MKSQASKSTCSKSVSLECPQLVVQYALIMFISILLESCLYRQALIQSAYTLHPSPLFLFLHIAYAIQKAESLTEYEFG